MNRSCASGGELKCGLPSMREPTAMPAVNDLRHNHLKSLGFFKNQRSTCLLDNSICYYLKINWLIPAGVKQILITHFMEHKLFIAYNAYTGIIQFETRRERVT